MIMQNRVTIRGEYAQIAEEARAQQLLNRQRLNNRTQKNKIIRETKRRHDAAERAGLTPSTREGGMLEFKPRVVRKIRSGRSISERGFLLLPSSGFDAEGKIYVRSAYGENPYAVTPGTPGTRSFIFANGRLEPGPSSLGVYSSDLTYDIPNNYENANQFTLERFLYLPAIEDLPTIESLGDDLYRITEYGSCYISYVLWSLGPNGYHHASLFSKIEEFLIPSIPGVTNQPTLTGVKNYWTLRDNVVGSDLEDVELLVDTGTYHFAVTSNNGQVKEFFNGNLVRTQTFDPIIGIKPLKFKCSISIYKVQIVVKKTGSTSREVISEKILTPPFTAGISSIRFTPGVELYSGSSFTPPTSITDLA